MAIRDCRIDNVARNSEVIPISNKKMNCYYKNRNDSLMTIISYSVLLEMLLKKIVGNILLKI